MTDKATLPLDEIVASAIADMAIYDSLRPSERAVLAYHEFDWNLTTFPPSTIRFGGPRLRRTLDRQIQIRRQSDG